MSTREMAVVGRVSLAMCAECRMRTRMNMLGRVVEIHRYPVKSMRGESIDSAQVTLTGLFGDRGFALYDPEVRKALSAKQVAALLECSARLDGEQVEIRLPDDRTARSDDPACARILSDWFGKPIGIAALADRLKAGGHAMAGTYFDYAPLHIVTRRSLESLARGAGESMIPVERFRPNLLIDCDSLDPFPENAWTGHVLRIGEITARVTDPCPRCVMTTLAQGALPKEPRVLRHIAQSNTVFCPVMDGEQPCLGAYAFVLTGGVVRTGDRVRLE